MPAVAAGTLVAHLDPAAPWAGTVGAVPGGTHLRAAAVARVHLRYDDTKADLVHDEEYEAVLFPLPQLPDPSAFVAVDYDDRDLLAAASGPVVYGLPVADVASRTWWSSLRKALADHLVRTRALEILVNRELKAYSRVGETREEFVARCAAIADAEADKATAALTAKYRTKLDAWAQKHQAASSEAARLQAEYDAQYGAAAQVVGMLGGLLGGRRSRSSVAAEVRRQSAANAKIGTTQAKAGDAASAYHQLEAELGAEVAAIDATWRAKADQVDVVAIPLEKNDVAVADLRLVWIPTS